MTANDADAILLAVAQLGALAENLAGRGFTATVTQAGRYPSVGAANRSVPQLSETVHAAPAEDGTWWFWWSWADRIAPVSDIETAAFKIAYVLTPHADDRASAAGALSSADPAIPPRAPVGVPVAVAHWPGPRATARSGPVCPRSRPAGALGVGFPARGAGRRRRAGGV